MNILLCHKQKESLEMIQFCLESQMDLVVHSAANFLDALEFFLEESSVDLVITSEQADTDKLFKFLLSTNSHIPVIILHDNDHESLQTYPDIRVLGRLHFKEISEKLIPLIKNTFKGIVSSPQNDEYCRIKTSLLVQVTSLKTDLYIRLSSLKYVKIFKAGTTFNKEDLENFLAKKKISFLYVKRTECQEFIGKFSQELTELLVHAHPDDPALTETIVETQELIQELTHRIGFNSEVRNLAKINVSLTMKAIGTSPKLTKILNTSLMSGKNFISAHSVVLANIACAISAQMSWPSDTTFQKLIMAALFHDFTFQNPEHAKITSLKQLEDRRASLTPEDYALIKNHPIKCSETIKQLHEIPSDVVTIVMQHHERPDGSGYPRGIDSHQIAPLAAVFIVAHDILNAVVRHKNKFNLGVFLKETESLYQIQAFRKVWLALGNSNSKKQNSDGSKNSAA